MSALRANGSGTTQLPSEILQFYRSIVATEAQGLPEMVSVRLVHAWSALTRTDSIAAHPSETFLERLQQFWVEIKQKLGDAEQIDQEAEQKFLPNVSWLLLNSPSMTFGQAVDEYIRNVKRGTTVSAETEKLSSARTRETVIEWLRSIGVYVSSRPQLLLPGSTIRRILTGYQGQADIHLQPTIPADKLANAVETCGVPDHDSVSALVDCTIWGSAKDAVLFGSRGVYFHNFQCSGYIPYCDFPYGTFAPIPGETVVSFGSWRIKLNGSQVTAAQLVDMLDLLRKEARRLQSRVETKSEGLNSIAGMHSLKTLLRDEVVAPLLNPDEFRKYKLGIPNGIFLYGPPGCGKTFIAQKLADELQFEFIEISPATVGSPYIHETGLKIQSFFEQAAHAAPSLMFVDEFEGLVPSRFSLTGNDQYKAEEVNEWLVQIGRCSERGILFVAATNHPWKVDKAVRRSGRLDKKVYVGPPDGLAIAEMLRYHLVGRPVVDVLAIDSFADAIDGQGYSASDLKVLVDEAARLAMRERSAIRYEHLELAAAQKVSPSISADIRTAYELFEKGANPLNSPTSEAQ